MGTALAQLVEARYELLYGLILFFDISVKPGSLKNYIFPNLKKGVQLSNHLGVVFSSSEIFVDINVSSASSPIV